MHFLSYIELMYYITPYPTNFQPEGPDGSVERDEIHYPLSILSLKIF